MKHYKEVVLTAEIFFIIVVINNTVGCILWGSMHTLGVDWPWNKVDQQTVHGSKCCSTVGPKRPKKHEDWKWS